MVTINCGEGLSNQDNGFSLLEVLIAITILSFALLSLAAMATTVIRGNSYSHKVSTATTLTQDKIEAIKNVNYSSIASQAGTEGYGTITRYPNFSRQVTVVTNSPVSNATTITVTVSWTDTKTHFVTANTIIHSP